MSASTEPNRSPLEGFQLVTWFQSVLVGEKGLDGSFALRSVPRLRGLALGTSESESG